MDDTNEVEIPEVQLNTAHTVAIVVVGSLLAYAVQGVFTKSYTKGLSAWRNRQTTDSE